MTFSLEVWYAMSLGALVVLIMLCHRPLASLMCLRPLASLKRKLTPIISLVCHTNVSRVQHFLGCMYIAANGFAIGWGLRGSSNLATLLLMRSGSLASINMVPLFVGWRTSLLADWAGVSLHAYYTMHHWAGWMVVAQGAIHLAFMVHRLVEKKPQWDVAKISGILAVSCLAVVVLSNLQLLHKLHAIFAGAVVGSLIVHATSNPFPNIIYPAVSVLLWLSNTVTSYIRVYRNRGRISDLKLYRETGKQASAASIKIRAPTPSPLPPGIGHYYYLYFQTLGTMQKLQPQAHRYPVCMSDRNHLTFLLFHPSPLLDHVEKREVDQNLEGLHHRGDVWLDGLYRFQINVVADHAGNAFLFASKSGISQVLCMAQALVEAVDDPKGPISIFWEVEEDKMVNWNDGQDTEMIHRQQSNEGKSVQCSIVRCVEEVVASPMWKGKIDLHYVNRDGFDAHLWIKEHSQARQKGVIAVCGDKSFTTVIRSVAKDFQNLKFEEIEYIN